MTRRTSLLLCGAAAVVTVTLGATTSRASVTGTEAASCPPVSATQLHAILGFPQSLQTRNTVNSGRADHYLCNGVAWRGPAPSTPQGALQKGKAGQGAAFGIEAWTPNEGSPDADRWPDDYDKLTGRFDIDGVVWPGLFTNKMGWPSKHVNPSHFGYQATGLVVTVGSGPAKGLVAAVGCWWNDNALSAVCLMVEEAPGKPVVTHLNQLAQIAVPKVL